jgi:hypothetical protein
VNNLRINTYLKSEKSGQRHSTVLLYHKEPKPKNKQLMFGWNIQGRLLEYSAYNKKN